MTNPDPSPPQSPRGIAPPVPAYQAPPAPWARPHAPVLLRPRDWGWVQAGVFWLLAFPYGPIGLAIAPEWILAELYVGIFLLPFLWGTALALGIGLSMCARHYVRPLRHDGLFTLALVVAGFALVWAFGPILVGAERLPTAVLAALWAGAAAVVSTTAPLGVRLARTLRRRGGQRR